MSTPENISRAGRLIGVVVGLSSFSCAIVSLRMWVRLQLTRQGLGLDDAFILAAVVSVNTMDEGGFSIYFFLLLKKFYV